MKAKIIDGEFDGVEFEISDETLKNLKNESKGKGFRVWKFMAKPENLGSFWYALALECTQDEYRFPSGYKSRGAFDKTDIRKIIKGLKEMIGD